MEALVEGLRTDATWRRGALTASSAVMRVYAVSTRPWVFGASHQRVNKKDGYVRRYVGTIGLTGGQCEPPGGRRQPLSRVIVWDQTCPNAVYTDAFALALVQFRFRPYARAPLSPLP